MGRPRKKSLQFSTEDRNELQRIASSRTEPVARVSCARALLAYEDGEGNILNRGWACHPDPV